MKTKFIFFGACLSTFMLMLPFGAHAVDPCILGFDFINGNKTMCYKDTSCGAGFIREKWGGKCIKDTVSFSSHDPMTDANGLDYDDQRGEFVKCTQQHSGYLIYDNVYYRDYDKLEMGICKKLSSGLWGWDWGTQNSKWCTGFSREKFLRLKSSSGANAYAFGGELGMTAANMKNSCWKYGCVEGYTLNGETCTVVATKTVSAAAMFNCVNCNTATTFKYCLDNGNGKCSASGGSGSGGGSGGGASLGGYKSEELYNNPNLER